MKTTLPLRVSLKDTYRYLAGLFYNSLHLCSHLIAILKKHYTYLLPTNNRWFKHLKCNYQIPVTFLLRDIWMLPIVCISKMQVNIKLIFKNDAMVVRTRDLGIYNYLFIEAKYNS